MTSFSKKKIDVIMQLAGNKTFNDMGDNTLTLTGLRVEANLAQVGSVGQGSKATIKIYGMTQSDMNKLSVIAMSNATNTFVDQNHITVMAGIEGDMTKVYEGAIFSAWADYSSLPEVPFIIQATALADVQNKPAKAHSWQKGKDLAEAIGELASEMNLSFTNINVDRKMENTTLEGNLVNQLETLTSTYGIYSQIEFNMLTIAEFGTPVDKTIIEINPETGLIGVPSVGSKSISISTLFNVNYRMGYTINLKSLLSQLDGKWLIGSISHNLESEKPNGAWFTTLSANRVGAYQNKAEASSQDAKDSNLQAGNSVGAINANTESVA